MRYQILTQKESGEAWQFYAHGARYKDKAEAESAIEAIEARGNRARLIACGAPAKGKAARAPVRVAVSSRASYWRTGRGLYVSAHPGFCDPRDVGTPVSGYPRLDSLMRLKGERPDLIARHCDEFGQFRESGE